LEKPEPRNFSFVLKINDIIMVKVRTRKAMTHPSFRMVVSRSLLVGQIKDDDLIREEDENIRKDESTFYLGHRL
jgi:hypothetical protein